MKIQNIINEFMKDFTLKIHIKDLIFIKDSEFKYIYWNSEYEDFLSQNFSIKHEQIKNKTDFDLYPLEIAKKCRESDLETKEKSYFIGSEFINSKEYILVKLKLKESDNPKGGILTIAKYITN